MLGVLLVAMLPDNRIVYTQTHFESLIDETKAQYNLFVLSLDDFEKSTITHRFDPVKITETVRKPSKRLAEFDPINYQNRVKVSEKRASIYKERVYKSPLQRIMTDNNYIFAFTFQKNAKEELFTDVFDANTGNYLCSAFFPFFPNVIKNGYVYRITTNEDGFPVVEKYKITPAVYGK